MEKIKNPIIIALISLLLFVVYYFPVRHLIQTQKIQAQQNSELAGKLTIAVPTLLQSRQERPKNIKKEMQLLSYLDQSMKSFKMKGYQPNFRQVKENNVEVSLKDASFSDWLIWLKKISQDNLVRVDRVDITAGKSADQVKIIMQVTQ